MRTIRGKQPGVRSMRGIQVPLPAACLLGWIGLILITASAAAMPAQSSEDSSQGRDWPQFLGPDRNGISQEHGLIRSWPEQGPEEKFRVPCGVGMSGLAVVRGRLYTMAQDARDQLVMAFDAATGERIWEQAVAPAYKNQMGNGPRATPTVTGDVLYVFTGEGVLACLTCDRGEVLWRRDLVAEFSAKPAEYGMACSPLLVGDKVVVTVGAPEATVVACDRGTGEPAWHAGRGEAAGYSSPVLLQIAEDSQLVVFTGASALGLKPESGRVLWHYPYETDFDCNIATPLVYKDQIFLSAGENHGCVMLGLDHDDDSYKVRDMWKSQGPRSEMRNEWQTSILLDGYLYGLDNVGSAGPVTHLACVNAETGAQAWRQVRFGKGNLICADGRLFISTMQGELVVVQATPDGYEELGRKEVIGPTRQAPALAQGLLYLRDDQQIVCLDVRQH